MSDIGNFNGSAIRFNFPSILPRPAPAEHLKTFDEDRKSKYFLFIWIHFIRHSKTYEKLNQQNMKRSAAEDCHLIMIVSNRVSQKSDLQNAAGTQKS